MRSITQRLVLLITLILIASLGAPAVFAGEQANSPSSTASRRSTDGMTLLGEWTTRFTPSDWNGWGTNIRVPVNRLDGTVLQPGAKLDFIRATGPFTNPPYKMGAALANGRIRKGKVLGGGMCSSAVTMFNAAVRAGLQIVERHAHSLYIDRYPVGLDATVFGTSRHGQNLVFRNDTNHPILIKGIARKRSVTLQVWGTDDGRTTEFSEPTITDKVDAKLYLEYTDELSAGERESVHDNYNAFRSVVTRTVRAANGDVIHEDTFRSRYKLLNGLTLVGRYRGDPPAGTRILASNYPH